MVLRIVTVVLVVGLLTFLGFDHHALKANRDESLDKVTKEEAVEKYSEEKPLKETNKKTEANTEESTESKTSKEPVSPEIEKTEVVSEEEKKALAFFISKMDKYDKLLNLFWSGMGDEQTWNLTVELRYKKTDEAKFKKYKVSVDSYVDLNQLKAMFRVSSKLAHFKAFSDGQKTLLLSRDTKQYCLRETPIKTLLEKMKAAKKNKTQWDTSLKKIRKHFLEVLGLNHMKLIPEDEMFDGVRCEVLSFKRHERVNYFLYFDKDTGWLKGICLKSDMDVTFTFSSNTSGYPVKFEGVVKNLSQGQTMHNLDIGGDLLWKDGRLQKAQMLIKTLYNENLNVELGINVSLDDANPLRKNVFQAHFNKENYKVKSFDDFRKGLLDHAVAAFTEDQ